MKRHIIFDFDDTMSSAYEHNQQLFVDTFLPYKPDIDQDYVRKVHYVSRGTSMLSQFEEVIKKFDLKISAEKLVEENEVLHQQKAGDVKIFDGFKDIVTQFDNLGKIISLCTNRAEKSLMLILAKNNLSQHFDNIISCKDAGHEKPDPYCLNQLIEKYPDVDKSEIIYFGDSKTDAEFAQNAGVDYLVVDHYLNKKQFWSMVLNSFGGIQDELLVEVSDQDKDVGVIYKMEAHNNPSRFHRAAHIALFNSKGQIILQKRPENKITDPGSWDVPGGHQSYGQNIDQTAEIELMEEMGVRGDIRFKSKWLKKDERQSEFCYLYHCVSDGPYKYDALEVSEVKAFDCQKILDEKFSHLKFTPQVKNYISQLKDVWAKSNC